MGFFTCLSCSSKKFVFVTISSKAPEDIGLSCSTSLSFVLRRRSDLSYLLAIYTFWAEISKAVR